MKQPTKLMLAGDWHGNAPWASHAIEHAYAEECDTILQLGDFGWWTPSPSTDHYLREVQDALEHYGIDLYWIDGNHEDHGRLAELQWRFGDEDPWTVGGYSRIWHLPRGYQWEWFDKTWMAVGGAVSVDKHMRKRGLSWWPEEELTDEQVEFCCRGPVDVIVSHDCPAGVFIPGLGGNWPQDVLLDADRHRGRLRQIWDKTGATELFHGHYHRAYRSFLGDGLVVGLDCDSTTIRDNTMVYAP